MSKIEDIKAEGIIKDTASKVIKDTELIALQVVDSATTVIKAGIVNAEDISIKINDVLLNTARRAINSSSIIGIDVREATENMTKNVIHSAKEIKQELKNAIKTIPKGDAKADEVK